MYFKILFIYLQDNEKMKVLQMDLNIWYSVTELN